MEAAAKRVRAGDPTVPTEDDRLSDLPDDLLLHLLSFLPSRHAVQTTVLSKRWSGLWRSVRCIDVEIDVDHGRHYGHSYSKEKWQKAEDFVSNLLMLHDAPSVDAFRIYIGSNHKDLAPTINGWVCGAIKHYRPPDIEIAYTNEGAYRLPHLGLGSGTALLKKLYLYNVYLDWSFEEQLRSGFTVLEDLTLNDCCTYFRHIQSSTLRRLVLRDCWRSSDTLVIRAPALVSLTIVSLRYSKNVVKLDGPTDCLVNASIFPFDQGSSNPSRASLLVTLFNVTNLELIGLSAEVCVHTTCCKFHLKVYYSTVMVLDFLY
jgi:hypothetical protein